MLENLRTGAWLTCQRLYAYPTILLGLFAAAAVVLVATSHAGIDAFGRPLGTDFSGIFTAGRAVAEGHPALPYDVAAFRAAQGQFFDASQDFYTWFYPPYFLVLAGLIARLPYFAALALWQTTTLALYLAVVLLALRPARLPLRPVLVMALAFPAVFINLMHGQNGFLTAALLAGGLLLLRHRQLAAGLCFALLAYKPQFGVLVIPALIAGGYWRACAAAAVTFTGMTLTTLAALGPAPWQGFFTHLEVTRVALEQGAVGFAKLTSPFAAVRLLGGSVTLAYAIQGAASLAMLAALIRLWRSAADFRLKAAALLAASLIATPHVFDYDMAMLAPALAFAASYGVDKGFGPYEKSGLAFLWIMPLLARSFAGLFLVPLGPLAVLLFLIGILRRGQNEQGERAAACADRPAEAAGS